MNADYFVRWAIRALAPVLITVLVGIVLGVLYVLPDSCFQQQDNSVSEPDNIDGPSALSTSDLSDDGQLEQAFHYTNCRPLLARDNRSKGNRWTAQDEELARDDHPR